MSPCVLLPPLPCPHVPSHPLLVSWPLSGCSLWWLACLLLECLLPASVGQGTGTHLPNLEDRKSRGSWENSVSSPRGLPGGGDAWAGTEGQSAPGAKGGGGPILMASHLRALCCPPHLAPPPPHGVPGLWPYPPTVPATQDGHGTNFLGPPLVLAETQRAQEASFTLFFWLLFCLPCFNLSLSKGKIHGEHPVNKITHLVPSESVSQLLLI